MAFFTNNRAPFGLFLLLLAPFLLVDDKPAIAADKVVVMTARPGTVKCIETIDLPRPRDEAMTTAPDFVAIKRRLLDEIREESMKTFAGTAAAG